MKFLFTLITFMVFSLSNNSYGQTNVPYWKEGFSTSTLTRVTPIASGGEYFKADAPGTWYGFNVYTTTGTGCPAGNWHVRGKNIAGVTDSGYLVTPIVSNGIQEFHFARARASRPFTFYVTTDTNAVTATWTYVTEALSRATTITCVDTTIMINAPTAKRLKIVMRPGTDTDIDSLWVTNSSPVLPIELLSFSGKFLLNDKGGSNLLTWQTASEVNNKGFNIERLMDNGQWVILGFKTANNKASTYEFTDNTPLPTSYYRLRQIDNDGKETLSKVISIAAVDTHGRVYLHPNPVSNVLTVEYTDGTSRDNREGSLFQVINLLGQQVLVGKTTQQLDVSALPQGTYVLKVGTEVAKFVKQ